MSKDLPTLTAATALTGDEDYLVNQGGNPRRASDTQLMTRFAGGFTHTQASAATTWTVNHNLGRKPSGVAVLSPGGMEVMADVLHLNDNQLQVSFVAAQTGSVRCI